MRQARNPLLPCCTALGHFPELLPGDDFNSQPLDLGGGGGIGEDPPVAVAAFGAVRDGPQFVVGEAAVDDQLADSRGKVPQSLEVVLVPLFMAVAAVKLGQSIENRHAARI